tara:strand:- start:73 stop:1104 length:1032 start_codon:yes stop_codon:yes gene_type:complete
MFKFDWKIFKLSYFFISSVLIFTYSYADAPYETYFKEPNAKLTKFSDPNNFNLVEKESEGAGWRYFESKSQGSKKVILYNHGWSAVGQKYNKLASEGDGTIKSRKYATNRNQQKIADFFGSNSINFYSVLRKDTAINWRDFSKASEEILRKEAYGKQIEPLEVFYHLTKLAKKELGEDCEICYVGHSAGGASPLFTSMYLKDKNAKHVAMSPENCMLYDDQYRFIEKGKFCDRTFFENRYNSLAKNLTILYGGNEIKTPGPGYTYPSYLMWVNKVKDDKKWLKKRKQKWENHHKHTKSYYDKALTFKNPEIKVVVVGNLNHTEIAEHTHVSEWGKAVIKACGF